MIFFADYEGLGVIFSELYWFAATILALLCALSGTIAGLRRIPRPRLAFWLGVIACVIEVTAATLVQLAFVDEQRHIGEYAERFRPGWFFWSLALATTALALLAVGLGRARRSIAQVSPFAKGQEVG